MAVPVVFIPSGNASGAAAAADDRAKPQHAQAEESEGARLGNVLALLILVPDTPLDVGGIRVVGDRHVVRLGEDLIQGCIEREARDDAVSAEVGDVRCSVPYAAVTLDRTVAAFVNRLADVNREEAGAVSRSIGAQGVRQAVLNVGRVIELVEAARGVLITSTVIRNRPRRSRTPTRCSGVSSTSQVSNWLKFSEPVPVAGVQLSETVCQGVRVDAPAGTAAATARITIGSK